MFTMFRKGKNQSDKEGRREIAWIIVFLVALTIFLIWLTYMILGALGYIH